MLITQTINGESSHERASPSAEGVNARSNARPAREHRWQLAGEEAARGAVPQHRGPPARKGLPGERPPAAKGARAPRGEGPAVARAERGARNRGRHSRAEGRAKGRAQGRGGVRGKRGARGSEAAAAAAARSARNAAARAARSVALGRAPVVLGSVHDERSLNLQKDLVFTELLRAPRPWGKMKKVKEQENEKEQDKDFEGANEGQK